MIFYKMVKKLAKKVLRKEIRELRQANFLHEKLEEKYRNDLLQHKLRIRQLEEELHRHKVS